MTINEFNRQPERPDKLLAKIGIYKSGRGSRCTIGAVIAPRYLMTRTGTRISERSFRIYNFLGVLSGDRGMMAEPKAYNKIMEVEFMEE